MKGPRGSKIQNLPLNKKLKRIISCFFFFFFLSFLFPQMKRFSCHLPVETCPPIPGMTSPSSGSAELQQSSRCRLREQADLQALRSAGIFKAFPTETPALTLDEGARGICLSPRQDHCITSSLAASWLAAKQESARS